jgi:hypothetical protein
MSKDRLNTMNFRVHIGVTSIAYYLVQSKLVEVDTSHLESWDLK